VRADSSASRSAGLGGRSLKTQQRGYVEVDVLLGEPDHPTAVAIKESGAPGVIAPDSLERR
jgi:hypothetical protein